MDDPDDTRWLNILDVNLTGSYLCSKVVLPHMKDPAHGRILNMSSVLGRFGVPGYAAYCTAKHGILGFTKALALEVAERGITVNAICPGAVRTVTNEPRMTYDARRLGKSVEEYEATMTPLGRRLESEEIAPMAVYMASDEASVITGQSFNIDGGVFMW